MASVTQLQPYQWKPGQSGNPAGRPKGARDRLESDFLYALADHFKEHGREAIDRLCATNVTGYIKAIASLMPRQLVPSDGLNELGDDDLRFLLGLARLARERAEARGDRSEGTGNASLTESAGQLQPVCASEGVP